MQPYRNQTVAALSSRAPTMPSLTIKNIPDDLYEQLKQAASAHHRSLNSELIYCLEQALKPMPMSVADIDSAAYTLRARVKTERIDTDEINDARNQGRK